MAKFDLIVCDPPWSFSDKLMMSETKRGSQDQYSVLTDKDIIELDVSSIAADDSVLFLWVPSSKLQVGLDTMKSWGFEQTQTFVWVKTKKPESLFAELRKEIKKFSKDIKNSKDVVNLTLRFLDKFDPVEEIDYNQFLNFYMGRLFRQTHEIALIGKKGKPYGALANKSQRSVLLDINLKHSAKPEGVQDRLDLMFPNARKIEIFARRDRSGWTCIGNESVISKNEDIRLSINKLKVKNEDSIIE